MGALGMSHGITFREQLLGVVLADGCTTGAECSLDRPVPKPLVTASRRRLAPPPRTCGRALAATTGDTAASKARQPIDGYQERRDVEVVVVIVVSSSRSANSSVMRRRALPEAATTGVDAVEAGGDDGDLDLVAHLVVDHGSEDDVGPDAPPVDDLGWRSSQQAHARRPRDIDSAPLLLSIADSATGR
jgi:hypothetical protein